MLNKFSGEEVIKGIVGDYPKIKEDFKKVLYDNGFRWQKDSYQGNGFGNEGVWINYGLRLSIRARWGKVNANAIIYVEKEFFGKVKKFFDLYFPNDGMDSDNYDYDLLNKGELFNKDELQVEDKEQKGKDKKEKKGKNGEKNKKDKSRKDDNNKNKIVPTNAADTKCEKCGKITNHFIIWKGDKGYWECQECGCSEIPV